MCGPNTEIKIQTPADLALYLLFQPVLSTEQPNNNPVDLNQITAGISAAPSLAELDQMQASYKSAVLKANSDNNYLFDAFGDLLASRASILKKAAALSPDAPTDQLDNKELQYALHLMNRSEPGLTGSFLFAFPDPNSYLISQHDSTNNNVDLNYLDQHFGEIAHNGAEYVWDYKGETDPLTHTDKPPQTHSFSTLSFEKFDPSAEKIENYPNTSRGCGVSFTK